ncbi:hypothetical protein FJY71_00210 [candidate division WOR-3 bacterium]|nr:hypothetical protein [candidate division WOR-3 bacterium]
MQRAVKKANRKARVIHADSPLAVADPAAIKGRRVLVVEDGPTVTHGNMAYGAGRIAAERFGAAAVVDPRPYAVGSLRRALKEFRHLKDVLPAMGYSRDQLGELEQTINAADCDAVVSGTPIDLSRIVRANKPIVRVRYSLEEKGEPGLEAILRDALKGKGC